MVKRAKDAIDTNLGSLLVNNTAGDIEADELLQQFRDLLDSYPNISTLDPGRVPIVSNVDGVAMSSSIRETETQVMIDKSAMIPGGSLDIESLRVSNAGRQMLVTDLTNNQMYDLASRPFSESSGSSNPQIDSRVAATTVAFQNRSDLVINNSVVEATIVEATTATIYEWNSSTFAQASGDFYIQVYEGSDASGEVYWQSHDQSQIDSGNVFTLNGGNIIHDCRVIPSRAVDFPRRSHPLNLFANTMYFVRFVAVGANFNVQGTTITQADVDNPANIFAVVGQTVPFFMTRFQAFTQDRLLTQEDLDNFVGPNDITATMVSVSDDNLTGALAGSANAQVAFDRIDNTGIGAAPRTFTGSFFASYGELGNQGIWYGGRQSVMLIGARGQSNGLRTFEIPDASELTSMFDDLASRGLGEVFTITIGYQGGSTSFINRNSLTIRAPSVSVGFPQGTFPTTIGQGASATFRIERISGVIQNWERLSIQNESDPVATIGEVVLQNTGWNNSDNSFLPPSGAVLQGYAFPVVGSNPNDGTLRQGLLDGGVSDRTIYDGDYVIWTAASFTSWANGDDWFVLSRNDMQRISSAATNFLSQVTEIDNRVDVAPVQMLTGDALVWVSENPLAAAPFLTPSTDTNNPRAGDDYAYIGGRENRNFMQMFQFGQNRFNSYLTVGITPQFIAGHPESDIRVRIYDTDRVLLDDFNLATDFTFRDDSDFTNSTVRHYTRSASINYPFLATVEIWLTRVAEHFRVNPETFDATGNIPDGGLVETKLSADVQEKLNRAIPPQGVTYDSIQDRLSPYATVTRTNPAVDARFYSTTTTAVYPSDLSDFTQVPSNNPVFNATDVVLFVAVPEPGNFILQNLTADTVVALDDSSPNVDVVESLSVSGVTYFVYRVTSITSGDRFEVSRTEQHQVVAWANEISNLEDDIERIDAELEHAALNLPADVVHFLEDLTVTEESTPTVNDTSYNQQLAGTSNTTQTVFYEPSPVAPGSGQKASQALSALSGDQVRRKLLMVPPSVPANQQSYIIAFDGTTGRDLISYINGEYLVNVRVPAQSASTITDTIYPAPATRVSGAGIWQTIPALTFVNGIPTPEADELFFTRNLPTSSTLLTIDYRGHANGNVFGTGQTVLAGVGGSSDAFANFTLNDGSEQLDVEVRYTASTGQVRVSETARVNTGLPTINDVQVILSYTETRTIPATPGTTRQVAIENIHDGWQVFAFKPGENGNLFVVGDQTEIDTNRTYETWFGAGLGGNISIADESATFLNFEDFEPIPATVQSLEDHATLPQFGLFSTTYTRETVVDTSVTLRPGGLNVNDLPTSATGLASGDVWFNGTALQFVP